MYNENTGAEKHIVKVRFLRIIVQIAASPHVKYHGLWATDLTKSGNEEVSH